MKERRKIKGTTNKQASKCRINKNIKATTSSFGFAKRETKQHHDGWRRVKHLTRSKKHFNGARGG